MKKTLWAKMMSLTLVLACVFSLAACGGGSSAAGSYTLQTISMSGFSMDLEQLAETYDVSMDELKIALDLKSNGNFTLDMSAIDDSMSMDGTWSQSGDDIALTIDGETLTVTLNGDVITLAEPESGVTMTFKK